MSETHTRGPWTLTHVHGRNFAVQCFEIRGANVSPIFNKDTSAINGARIFCSPEDARLIAAAPELLKACQLWAAYQVAIDADTPEASHLAAYSTAMDATLNALAKAEGSQS